MSDTPEAVKEPVVLEDHVITQEDLDNNPELVTNGVKVGDTIGLPKGVYDEAVANAEAKAEEEVPAEVAKAEPDATEESFSRLKPIVFAIIDMVASKKLPIGNNTHQEDEEYFLAAEKVLEFMRDGNMKYMEKESVFSLLLQPFDKIRTIVLSSLNKSANKAVDLKMGKQFGEVTLSDLDVILKAEVLPKA